MTRFIIYLLLFIVIFLSGIVVGISKQDEEEAILVEEVEEIEEQIEVESTLNVSDNGDKHLLTQKFASFLEKITSSIYDLVVMILYNIAKLFTG